MLRKLFVSVWKKSILFRVALILALILAAGRVTLHFFYLQTILHPDTFSDFLPSWWKKPDFRLPLNLQSYYTAAENITSSRDLYSVGAVNNNFFYHYSPAFALLYAFVLLMDDPTLVFVLTLVNMAAYAGLFILWAYIFSRIQQFSLVLKLVRLLPIWILFSGFWTGLGFLDLNVLIILTVSLTIYLLIEEKAFPAAILISLLFLTEPYWAFLLLIPLLFGRYRFFVKLFLLTFLGCTLTVLLTLTLVGWKYGLSQYQAYVQYALQSSKYYSWRTPQDGPLGYNHSLRQVIYYYFGQTTFVAGLVNLLQQLLTLPFFLIAFGYIIRPLKCRCDEKPLVIIDLSFSLYLSVCLWLDFLWQLIFSIVILVYLLHFSRKPWLKNLLWMLFIPYALIDMWQALSYLFFGPSVVDAVGFLTIDPSLYFPFLLILLLAIYVRMIVRLWRQFPRHTDTTVSL